jgi:glycerol-3-phosphate dehydrogenase
MGFRDATPNSHRHAPDASARTDEARYDVAVIGGGVNGTGTARDLALRGRKVVLFERNDFAFGASGNNSGMIHGGPRYMLKSPQVTEESCRDSGFIQQIAPFLLFRIPFIVPVKDGPRGRMMLELVDAYFKAYDKYQPLKRGEPHTRIDASEMARLEPGIVGPYVGAITFDEWGIDGPRLCILNAVDAEEHGARLYNHTTVESVAPGDDGYRITARDTLTGERVRARAAHVINATGAWAPVTAALGKLPTTRVLVRPGKGIHVTYDRRVSNYAVLAEAIDGREIFLMPWQNMSMIGTTDDDYYGDLDHVPSTSEEVRYLVQGAARVFPSIREARATGTYVGVRPTLYGFGVMEDALSREHAIIDHAADGAPGMYSMIGGKLASYRQFSQEMADAIAPSVPCTTHQKWLPGGDRTPDALALAETHAITPVAARRIVYRHGSRALRVLARVERCPREREVVCACEPVLAAEVLHVVEHEHARTVGDVARRTRLGMGSCGGMRCAARCGQIVADALGIAPAAGRAQAREFLERQAELRVVAMGPDQARQEALLLAQMRATLGEAEAATGVDEGES